ncbi:hypothetical protein DM02DRAFT_612394 [Periconia macrospinosa]|uniref:Calcium channel YVC1-like C-terminal transmembrane domain-containing protein n=1 Tax=Periconia macrospinosa TaxID=97972 RepID=A0A2V1E109_9PLEO|nr:hypothetical protein DM02DRAFT_612394 [Periconia macrospinosa]
MPRSNCASVPQVGDGDTFDDLTKKLSFYFSEVVTLPQTEEHSTSPFGHLLNPLVNSLSENCHHPAIVCALLALKVHFTALEEASDEPGVNEARGYACEIVAWQFVGNLTPRDAIDYLLFELPPAFPLDLNETNATPQNSAAREDAAVHLTEDAPLLRERQTSYYSTDTVQAGSTASTARTDEFTAQFEKLNALEIAAISNSKRFLSQRPVQNIIDGLWRGDIVFWDSIGSNSVRRAQLYNHRRADPFCRLRVPRYLKVFETFYFMVFLGLYYAVLIRRSLNHVPVAEALLYIWIAGFAYDEFGDFVDAGQTSFYATDFWWMWDISIVVAGIAFATLRIIGLTTASISTIDLSYDVLGLEALFLVPRIFSLLSLNSYFGTLIPCLKEMTKDFCKFLSLVVILYLGFLTTFVLLARGTYTPREMSWILIKVFFGSSYLGFDVAKEISPFFGPPVMLIFVALTNILLITSLISLLSNSLSKVLSHAREEYLFIYSVYVLEASSSSRLTYFLPPLNLIALLLRPLRLVLPTERLRAMRIALLKATHLPFVAAIWIYEKTMLGPRTPQSALSMSGPEARSVSKRLLRPSHQLARSLTARPAVDDWDCHVHASGSMHSTSRPQTRHVGSGPAEVDPQLQSLVVKLTAQVEELTTVVSQLREQREAGTAA